MPGVMEDQRETLAETTEKKLTDKVYLVRPSGLQTMNPWISKQRYCIFPLVYQVLGFYYALNVDSKTEMTCY